MANFTRPIIFRRTAWLYAGGRLVTSCCGKCVRSSASGSSTFLTTSNPGKRWCRRRGSWRRTGISILDPQVQVIIQKNGPGSYDFAANPRAREVVDLIRPKRVYVYGVATDFCVRAAALT